MKIRPEIFLLKNENINHKKILVTGSDEPLIGHVTEFIINKFKNKNFFIDSSGSIDKNLSGDLFSNNKILFVLRDLSSIKENMEAFNLTDQNLLISSPNKNKTNSIKSEILKSKDSLLLECYPLTRQTKEVIIKEFIEKNNIDLSSNMFWYVLDNFDNNYISLKKQLELLSLWGGEITSALDIEKVVSIESRIEINKFFFKVFKKNKILIDYFNKNINSQGDFYIFLNSLKLYLGIIISSSNKEVVISNFPKYLFNEKDVFLKIYNLLNKKKIEKIYKNILKVEMLTRKHSSLYLLFGIRFLINTKNIITS